MTSKVYIFYDGDCGFCQWWVQFFLQRNPGDFYFAPLQGTTAEKKLSSAKWTKNIDTLVVLTRQEKSLIKSSAAIYLLKNSTSLLWRAIGSVLWFCPRFLRNIFYDIIAKNRKRLVQSGFCAVPLTKDKKYLLD